MTNSFLDKIEKELLLLKEKSQFRTLKNSNKNNAIDLSTNDYLSISADKSLLEDFLDSRSSSTIKRFAQGGTSSRLLAGNNECYHELETKLAAWYKRESALVFSSGYHLNSGVIPALATRGDIIFSDKLNHASIVDGTILSRAEVVRYHHLDYAHLEEMLQKKRELGKNAFIISESVFSMDGDVADLRKLVELKTKYDAVLIVDEAHAAGVLGESGCGASELFGVIDQIDIIAGTFGKAFAGMGAYTISSNIINDYLINKARTLIFTTALPPITLNWLIFVLDRMDLFKERREKLLEISGYFREKLRFCQEKNVFNTHIIPFILGTNELALSAADSLQKENFIVSAVRPPTVPVGTSRLRFSLNSSVTYENIDKITEILTNFMKNY